MEFVYEIETDEEAIFIERPNRFIGIVKRNNGEEVICHVHDSGRLPELLYKGNIVKIRKATNPERKTKWDIISAKADGKDILVNSAFHRYISENILNNPKISPFGKVDEVKAEVKYGKSRIDYRLLDKNKEIWVEIKGVSLSVDREAQFPDAPSERAQKHLMELMEIVKEGHRGAVILLILRDSYGFRPKFETDPKFNELFYEAIKNGVEIYPLQLEFRDNKINYLGTIDIIPNKNERVEMMEDLKIGDIIGNKEIADFFKVTNQGGIRKSLKTKSIVVIAKFTDCLYKHSKKEDILYFVGMGKKGNHQLTRQNKALFDAEKEGFAIHVFEMYEEGNYTYKGIHKIVGDLKNEKQIDDSGEEREVIIFPLKKV
jgi:sugar fermentation stimulation protein A